MAVFCAVAERGVLTKKEEKEGKSAFIKVFRHTSGNLNMTISIGLDFLIAGTSKNRQLVEREKQALL